MRPAKKYLSGKVIAGTAAVTLFAILLSVGSANGRLIEWASTEYIYTPAPVAGYTSDCLTPQGQTIQLKNWSAGEISRTTNISISRPPEVTEPPTEPPAEDSTEPSAEDPTEVPTEAPTEDPAEEPTEAPTDPLPELPTEAPTDPVAPVLLDDETTATTEPTEPESVPTEPTEPETQPTEPTEPTEPETQPTEPTEPPVTEPPSQWTDGECIVTLDEEAAKHLTLSAKVTETRIQVTLTRRSDAPGLGQENPLSFQVLWQGLQGTFSFAMEPYGDVPPPEAVTDDIPQRQVVTGLQLFSACDVMDTENPVSAVKLNLQTCADFTLRFSCDNQPVHKLRWSLDGGKTYSMLYDSHQLTISWPYPEEWDGMVYLDFGQALTAQQRPTVNVMATEYTLQEYSPVRQAVPEPESFVLQIEELPYLVEMNPVWGSTQLEQPAVQRLTTDENGLLVYTDDPTLTALVEEDGIRLKPAQEAVLPESGSYRLILRWSWNGALLEESTVCFFVNTH